MLDTKNKLDLAKNIRIDTHPRYLREAHVGGNIFHLFRYTITVHNHNPQSVQLIERYWHIGTDEKSEEVRGEGVIGTQPIIQPNSCICYTSGISLATESGTMHGSYTMIDTQHQRFKVKIPLFILAAPSAIN